MKDGHIAWGDLGSTLNEAAGVEQWLWGADVATEMMNGTNLSDMKRAMLMCGSKFIQQKSIVLRSFQLLVDIEMLSDADTRIQDEDFTALCNNVEATMEAYGESADVLSACLELLLALYQRKGFDPKFPTLFMNSLTRLIGRHLHSEQVKRPAFHVLNFMLDAALISNVDADFLKQTIFSLQDEVLPVCADVILVSKQDQELLACVLEVALKLFRFSEKENAPLHQQCQLYTRPLVAVFQELVQSTAPSLPAASAAIRLLDTVIRNTSDKDSVVLDVSVPVLDYIALNAPSQLFSSVLNEEPKGSAEHLEVVKSLIHCVQYFIDAAEVLLLCVDECKNAAAAFSHIAQLSSSVVSSSVGDERGDLVKEIQAVTASISTLPEPLCVVEVTNPLLVPKSEEVVSLETPLLIAPQPRRVDVAEIKTADADADVNREQNQSRLKSSETSGESAAINPQTCAFSTNAVATKTHGELVIFAKDCQTQANLAIARADMMNSMFVSAAQRIERLVDENSKLRDTVSRLEAAASAAESTQLDDTEPKPISPPPPQQFSLFQPGS